MPRVTREVTIEATPEEIWRFVGDPLKELAWRKPNLKELELPDGEPVGIGSRYRGKTRFMGQENKYTNVITTFDPPHRVAWDWLDSSGPLAASGSYDLLPLSNRLTRFKITLNYRPVNFLGRLLIPFIDLFGGRILQGFLTSLKEQVEAGRAGGDR